MENQKKNEFWKFLLFFILIPVITIAFIEGPKKIEDWKLDGIVREVQTMILNGQLDEAETKAIEIRVQKNGWFVDDRYNRWESQRNDLLKLIEEKRKNSGR